MSESPKSNSFIVELDGCDRIEATTGSEGMSLHVIGCSKLLKLLGDLQTHYGKEIQKWPLPSGDAHEVLLVRELILKSQGKWDFPYQHAELCHCRTVAARVVDQAIVSGAHTPEVVSRRTSASTACGTCRPNVQKIIDFRLQKKAS